MIKEKGLASDVIKQVAAENRRLKKYLSLSLMVNVVLSVTILITVL